MADTGQLSLFDPSDEASEPSVTHAAVWERDAAKRALDELFSLTHQYKSSQTYRDLLHFVTRFRSYSPFNAMLVHIQMPGAIFVASPHRWLRDYGRRIAPSARPLVILQPMGPVMFVFDVSETEPTERAPSLPPEVEDPFEVRKGHVGSSLEMMIENAKRDGIRTGKRKQGSQSAGSIRWLAQEVHELQPFQSGYRQESESGFHRHPGQVRPCDQRDAVP